MPRPARRRSLAKNPKDVEVLLLHANALAALRDPAGAIAQIEEALKVNPNSSPAFVNLGAVRMQSGEAKEAEAAFRKAIELEPASVDAKLALANFLWAARTRAGSRGHPQGGARQGAAAPARQPHAGRAVLRHHANQGSGAAPQGRGRRLEDACRPFSAGRLLRERRPHQGCREPADSAVRRTRRRLPRPRRGSRRWTTPKAASRKPTSGSTPCWRACRTTRRCS